jgi:hypothetical protein
MEKLHTDHLLFTVGEHMVVLKLSHSNTSFKYNVLQGNAQFLRGHSWYRMSFNKRISRE